MWGCLLDFAGNPEVSWLYLRDVSLRSENMWTMGARLTIFPCLFAAAMIATLRANTTSLLKKLLSQSHDLENLKYQVSATDH